ncbi:MULTISPECIES: flagellar hook assembly protein FlgD [Sphingopyxis]|jgi:flagellar basal-body rod modification protein FlgD|uniref:Basal-body rod modification protein FlgD n=1 Tax=Sphingopyxis granuli TaxID=267128 RepID=A0AA86GT38_9SPHN|nr:MULTISPECIES: flagellar hook capping FlgD N-terminal domain-containing protein [Sphingopyxis]AMG76445.1 Flagellar hook capping protein [Sphingopyxis granuli]APW73994.1 flagellar hook capping protein [Sphingopyxis granuli]AVA15325.1 flagellar hook capping protein [Sphingopyxis sp. MG]ODU28519.1 MAG: flagellar hook capping protein [Sphingopyxis sp. SCN 67-31]QUM72668.1 flagellar hook capping protein [Sphingopyxis granuli]
MTSTSAVNGSNIAVVPKNSGTQLGQQDFLRLMTAQLSQQDPFNPVDNQQMVAQMAQFSSLAGISETNTTLKSIADQLGAQTALLKDIKAAQIAATPTTQSTQEG